MVSIEKPLSKPSVKYHFNARNKLIAGNCATNQLAPSARHERRKAEKLAKVKLKHERKQHGKHRNSSL